MRINLIKSFDEIVDLASVVALISKQMKVVSNEKSKEEIVSTLKKVLFENSSAHLFLLESNESYCGFAFGNISFGLESGGRYFWLNEIYIDEDMRNKGYGNKLIDFIEDWARDEGIKYMACVTGKGNHKAREFYNRCSYDLNEVFWVDKLIGGKDE